MPSEKEMVSGKIAFCGRVSERNPSGARRHRLVQRNERLRYPVRSATESGGVELAKDQVRGDRQPWSDLDRRQVLVSTPQQRRVRLSASCTRVVLRDRPSEWTGRDHVGFGLRSSTGGRAASTSPKMGEKLRLAAAAPGEDEERIGVESFRQQEVDGGDVLARVLPVGARARRVEVAGRITGTEGLTTRRTPLRSPRACRRPGAWP